MAPEDLALPHLARALSPEALPAIREAAGLPASASVASASRIDLIKDVPGQRATILYRIGVQNEAPTRLIGKLYRSERRAARVQRWLLTLSSSVFGAEGRLGVPSPIGLVEELGMVLHEYIDAVDLRDALGDEDDGEPVKLAARWLARLHTAHPLDELKVRSVEHELEKAVGWLERVRAHVSNATQGRLSLARDQLLALLANAPQAELRTIHRDYYYANVLWDGAKLWVIDLDQLRIGDPALDVGHFTAHLDVLAYRQTGDFAAFAEQSESFVDAYRAERDTPDVSSRLPLYRAYTFLKLAATEAQRAREGWREATDAMAEAACRELDLLG